MAVEDSGYLPVGAHGAREVEAGVALGELVGERFAGRLVEPDQRLDQPAVIAHVRLHGQLRLREAAVVIERRHVPGGVVARDAGQGLQHQASLPARPRAAAIPHQGIQRQQALAQRVEVERRLQPRMVERRQAQVVGVVERLLEVGQHGRLQVRGDLESGRCFQPQHGVPPAPQVVDVPEKHHLRAVVDVHAHRPVRMEVHRRAQAVEQVAPGKLHRMGEVHLPVQGSPRAAQRQRPAAGRAR